MTTTPMMRCVALATALALLIGVGVAVGGCRKADEAAAVAGESCSVSDDGGVFAVDGRPDGIYAVNGDWLSAAPLARYDRIVRTAEGVEPSGKRWIDMRLADDEAHAVQEFTAQTGEGKGIAVVAGGEVASVHKVRQPITSSGMRVSCCNPRACERWTAILDRAK